MVQKRVKKTEVAEEKYELDGVDLTPHANAVGIAPEGGEAMGDFCTRILDAINAQAEEDWNALPDDTKTWSNDVNKVLQAAQKTKTAAKKKLSKEISTAKTKAKASVPKKKAATGWNGIAMWGPGSSARTIVDIVREAMPLGITFDGVVKAAEKLKVESRNIASHAKGVLRSAAITESDAHFGSLVKDGDLYKIHPDYKGFEAEESEAEESGSEGNATSNSSTSEKVAPKKVAPKKAAPKKAPAQKAAPQKAAPKTAVKAAPARPVKKAATKAPKKTLKV